MASNLGSVSPDDKKKMEDFIETAKANLQEIDDIRDGLKERAKSLADELGLKVKPIMLAARSAYKNDLAAKKADMDTAEDILNVTGNG